MVSTAWRFPNVTLPEPDWSVQVAVVVPLQEVVGGRATSTDGKVYCTQHMPGAQDGDLKLYFCDSCGVSIPLQDVITGTASTGGDRTICASCRRKPAPYRSH